VVWIEAIHLLAGKRLCFLEREEQGEEEEADYDDNFQEAEAEAAHDPLYSRDAFDGTFRSQLSTEIRRSTC
jgi:hypothetical protein